MSATKMTTEVLCERAVLLSEERRELVKRLAEVDDELQGIGEVIVGRGPAQLIKTSRGTLMLRKSVSMVADWLKVLRSICGPERFDRLVKENGVEKVTYVIMLKHRVDEDSVHGIIAHKRRGKG